MAYSHKPPLPGGIVPAAPPILRVEPRLSSVRAGSRYIPQRVDRIYWQTALRGTQGQTRCGEDRKRGRPGGQKVPASQGRTVTFKSKLYAPRREGLGAGVAKDSRNGCWNTKQARPGPKTSPHD